MVRKKQIEVGDNSGELLDMLMAAGVPFEPFAEGEVLEDILSRLFRVSKRQVRDWLEAKALRYRWLNKHRHILLIQRGKKLSNMGIICRVKKVPPSDALGSYCQTA